MTAAAAPRWWKKALVCEELAWGCTGISTTIMINNLAAIPIIVAGNDEQKKKWLGAMCEGQLGSYAVTEPAAGSDVAGILSSEQPEGRRVRHQGQQDVPSATRLTPISSSCLRVHR
ncbi:MAG: acyl-CoA dehydrogenase family protein [Anaerolineae bacterium]